MDIVYDWDIVKVEFVYKEDELYYVIKTIKFNFTGVEQTTNNKFTVPGQTDLLYPNPETFKPRGEIKKEDYIQWIKDSGISEDYMKQIICYEIMLQNQK